MHKLRALSRRQSESLDNALSEADRMQRVAEIVSDLEARMPDQMDQTFMMVRSAARQGRTVGNAARRFNATGRSVSSAAALLQAMPDKSYTYDASVRIVVNRVINGHRWQMHEAGWPQICILSEYAQLHTSTWRETLWCHLCDSAGVGAPGRSWRHSTMRWIDRATRGFRNTDEPAEQPSKTLLELNSWRRQIDLCLERAAWSRLQQQERMNRMPAA